MTPGPRVSGSTSMTTYNDAGILLKNTDTITASAGTYTPAQQNCGRASSAWSWPTTPP